MQGSDSCPSFFLASTKNLAKYVFSSEKGMSSMFLSSSQFLKNVVNVLASWRVLLVVFLFLLNFVLMNSSTFLSLFSLSENGGVTSFSECCSSHTG